MKSIFCVLLLSLLAVSVLATSCTKKQFEAFKTKYQKTYVSAAEEEARFAIFCASVDRIERRKQGNPKSTVTWGITKFSDLTPSEFKKYYLGYRKNENVNIPETKRPIPDITPAAFDWRSHSPSVLTPVYNQEQCGSCWAFSTVENIESQWALATGNLISMSPQQIVDCDTNDDGCGGGDTPTAYKYVVSAGGLDTWASYPYTAQDGNCQFKPDDVAGKITGFAYTGRGNETKMAAFMAANGPTSVCLAASVWSDYSGGIMTAQQCGDEVDHCVLIVGYDTTNSPPYWIVRNSWGTDWGVENGFIYLEYGTNTCDINSEPTSAKVDTSFLV